MTASQTLRSPLIRDSKLRVPRPRLAAVERRRLLNLLAAAVDVPIVLISGSAGYGKSTLAAQWSSRCGRPAAWVNLDRGDNDPLVFLNALVHAVDRIGPVAPELFDELSSPTPRVDGVVLPALAEELARLSPFELVLDDLHELTQPRSLALVNFLLEEIPTGSQVVLLTRAGPDLPLARRRVEDDVFEVRANRMALDTDETHDLAARLGANLSEASLALIHERTEGWPAGIALALRAAREQTSTDVLANGLGGTQRKIADYLVEMVLDREAERHRTFLLATSVLHRMTAPLCDAILGITGSLNVLRELEDANSFVIPLDDERGWYRYHQLFGELLRSELDRRHPELAAVYLARAAEWHEREGTDPEEAFRCAHECGDLERAGRIAQRFSLGMLARGQIETLRLWILDCTDEEVGADAQLAIAAAWVYTLLGEAEKAERFVLDAERGILDVPSADGATSVRSALANLRSALAPRGIHQMLADGEFVYAAERERRTRWLFGGSRAIGIANVLLGRPDAAIVSFREALMLSEDYPELAYPRALCLGYLAFAAADIEAWSDAHKWGREARALVGEHGFEDTLSGAVAYTAKAMLFVHDGDSHRATDELAGARRLRHLLRSMRWLNADIDLRWGDLSLDLGDRLAAMEHAVSARAVLNGYPDPGNLPSRLAKLETRIGRAAELGLTPAELRIMPFLRTHLTIKEIAANLHVSPATVKTHFSQIYSKFGASTRSEAVDKAEQLRL